MKKKKKKGKKRRKTHNIDNGKVNVKDVREGKDRTDTYYKRSRNILKAAETLHSLTKAEIKVDVVLNWDWGGT